MNAFIDEHRARCGVESICTALQVAPSAYRRHAARQRHPALLPQRAKRDALLLPEVRRVFDQNLQVYGADKVWKHRIGKYRGAQSGRNQRMGAILKRMQGRGLVWVSVTEHNQRLWTASEAGRKEIAK